MWQSAKASGVCIVANTSKAVLERTEVRNSFNVYTLQKTGKIICYNLVKVRNYYMLFHTLPNTNLTHLIPDSKMCGKGKGPVQACAFVFVMRDDNR